MFPQPWFGRPDTAKLLAAVGEFGGRKVDLGSSEGRWQRRFLNHLARSGNPQPQVKPEAGVRPTVVEQSCWDAGWCGQLEITGSDGADLSHVAVSFTLPAGTRITQTWNGDFSATEGRVRVGLPAWARAPMTSTGFCVAGTGAASDVQTG